MFRVVVCGSRDYSDSTLIDRTLSAVSTKHADLVIVEGGARGADSMAGAWADQHGIDHEIYPADWSTYGKSAGFRRNAAMIASAPGGVVAFFTDPSAPSRGTQHTVDLATKAGIPVWIPQKRTSC